MTPTACSPLLPACVYGCATQTEPGAPLHFFYVGGLRRTPGVVDVREHVAIMRGLQVELARAFERIQRSGLRHGFVILHECADDEARQPGEALLADQIRWQIIKLIRDGHRLVNERLGTTDERERLAYDIAGAAIQSPADLARRRALLRRRAVAKERRAHALAQLEQSWRRRTSQHSLEEMLRKALPVLSRRLKAIDATPPAPDLNRVDALFAIIRQAREACPHRFVIPRRARRKAGSVGAPAGGR
jgi:hypothetical protein